MRLLTVDAVALRTRMGRVSAYAFPQFTAVALYRLSRLLRLRGHRMLARLVFWLNQFLTGAEMEPIAVAGPGLVLAHTHGVLLGQQSCSGANLFVHGGVLLGSTSEGFPRIGDGVVLYAKASVIGPVLVGDGAIVGAHALVLTDVPPMHIARGVPANSTPAAGTINPMAGTRPASDCAPSRL
jgi:serine O-acetyltransferase